MPKLNQRGVVHLLVPILLLAGIIAGVYLILQGPKIFKSKAGPGETISIVAGNGVPIHSTSSPTVMVKLTSPDWAFASSVGTMVKEPTSAINYSLNSGYLNWQNPKGVLTDDASYANIPNLSSGKLSNTGSISGFGFSIPTDASISGVLVEIKRGSQNGTGVVDKDVRIGVGRKILSPENKAKADIWPNTESYVSYGGQNDLWGLTLTPKEVNDPNFGVGLQVGFADTGTGTDRAGVNHVRMTIYYILPSPPPVTTASINLAEDPNFTVNSQTLPFTTELVSYTFSNSDPGIKTLYGKFTASDGQVQNANPFPATVELLAPTPSPSGFDKAIKFSRGSNYLQVDRYTAKCCFNQLNTKGSITLETWMQLDETISPSDSAYLMYKSADYLNSQGTTVTSALYYLQLKQNRIDALIHDTNLNQEGRISLVSNSLSEIGVWHHIAVVYDTFNSPTLRFYLDGKLVSTGTMGTPVYTNLVNDEQPLYIMGNPGSKTALPVTLDDMRIYNGVAYISDFVPQKKPFTSSNLGLWHFDGNVLDYGQYNAYNFQVVGNVEYVDSTIAAQ